MTLDCMGQLDPPVHSIAKQAPALSDAPRCGDDQELADAGQHQRGQRIIDQRLVVDWQQLLRCCECQRIQPRSPASRQNDALAIHTRALFWPYDLTFRAASLPRALPHLKMLSC